MAWREERGGGARSRITRGRRNTPPHAATTRSLGGHARRIHTPSHARTASPGGTDCTATREEERSDDSARPHARLPQYRSHDHAFGGKFSRALSPSRARTSRRAEIHAGAAVCPHPPRALEHCIPVHVPRASMKRGTSWREAQQRESQSLAGAPHHQLLSLAILRPRFSCAPLPLRGAA